MSKDESHKILNHPLTSYDNRSAAKGAMILALEKCSVSEKNIKGMLGVIDYILQTTSEYELKQTYKEHIRAYKKENDNTFTQVNLLNEEEHIIEVAKLISGNEVSEASIEAARELIGNK